MKTVTQGFEEFLRRMTPTDTQRASGSNHRKSVKAALESSFRVLRFFESGSFSHGTGVRNFSDIDVFVELDYTQTPNSGYVLQDIYDVLNYRFPSTPVDIDPPAVVVKFGGGYETWEVIPAFFSGSNGDAIIYDIPAPRPGTGWIRSSPDAHLAHVDVCNQVPSYGNAKALARLVKAWKYFNDVPVSSFYLEMRAAQYMAAQASFTAILDIRDVFDDMRYDSLAPMRDPSGLTDEFQACSDPLDCVTATYSISQAAGLADHAANAWINDYDSNAFDYLAELFAGEFPSRYG